MLPSLILIFCGCHYTSSLGFSQLVPIKNKFHKVPKWRFSRRTTKISKATKTKLKSLISGGTSICNHSCWLKSNMFFGSIEWPPIFIRIQPTSLSLMPHPIREGEDLPWHLCFLVDNRREWARVKPDSWGRYLCWGYPNLSHGIAIKVGLTPSRLLVNFPYEIRPGLTIG